VSVESTLTIAPGLRKPPSSNAERSLERRRRVMLIVNLLIAAAVAVIAILTSRAADWEPVALVAVLGAFSVASELMDFKIMRGSLQSWSVTSSAPLALCIALLGPAPSVAIGAVSLAATAAKSRTPLPDVVDNYANYGVLSARGRSSLPLDRRIAGLEPCRRRVRAPRHGCIRLQFHRSAS